ncbi:MAG TPA: cyanophycinase [Ktedonobacteraceae bacterium]|nr:cyanophycinase [Ktedonobacteraceae bacterium]
MSTRLHVISHTIAKVLLSTLLFTGLCTTGFFVAPAAYAVGRHSAQTQAPAHKGRFLVLGGGALSNFNDPVYSEVVSLAGGKGVARIGIITAASFTPRKDGQFYVDLFLKHYGVADAEWIPIDRAHLNNTKSPKVIAQINSMTGFFFGGGDQSRLVFCMFYNGTPAPGNHPRPSPALKAIIAKYDAGAVVGGTSAGTDALVKDPMITGGESYEAIRNGAFPYIQEDHLNDLSYDPAGGFGMFTYGLLDTHFTERGRQGRLIRLAADTHTPMGYGIDQDTGLLITNADSPQAQMQVIGQHGVYILDLSKATIDKKGPFWSIFNVKVTYLTVGDSFDPNTKTVTIANWKTPLAGHEQHNHPRPPTHDIFSSFRDHGGKNGQGVPNAFTVFSTNLFDSRAATTYGLTYEDHPTFEVQMIKLKDASGYIGAFQGMQYISYIKLTVNIFTYRQ